MEKWNRTQKKTKPPEFEGAASPYLSAQASQCGQRAYISADDAYAVGALVCRACGLFHIPHEQVAA